MPTKTKAPTVTVTLAQFDSQGFQVDRDGTPIGAFTPLTLADYRPRGGTPLRDATARFVNHLEEHVQEGTVTIGLLLDRSGSMGGLEQSVVAGVNEFIGGMADVEATEGTSGKVLAVIFTDGQENASREVTPEALKAMVAEREARGWTFIYMGANQDAWEQGAALGIPQRPGAYTNYVSTPRGTAAAFSNLRSKGMGYLSEHGSLAAFSAGSSLSETGEETADNVAATPDSHGPSPTSSGYNVGEALTRAKEATEK